MAQFKKKPGVETTSGAGGLDATRRFWQRQTPESQRVRRVLRPAYVPPRIREPATAEEAIRAPKPGKHFSPVGNRYKANGIKTGRCKCGKTVSGASVEDAHRALKNHAATCPNVQNA